MSAGSAAAGAGAAAAGAAAAGAGAGAAGAGAGAVLGPTTAGVEVDTDFERMAARILAERTEEGRSTGTRCCCCCTACF